MSCTLSRLMTRSVVRKLLETPLSYEWSLQGFGMLRLHLPDEHRLNVWDSRYQVPNVSMIHTHPWDFDSLVVSGTLINQRYLAHQTTYHADHHGALIKPGTGGGMISTVPGVVADADAAQNEWWCLSRQNLERYVAGDLYSQQADEVHLSAPADGCVTLNRRTRTGADLARVFWPAGQVWVSAEPRVATREEVIDITERALALWSQP